MHYFTEDLSVNILEIDQQHQQIFYLLNNLIESCEQNKDTNIIEQSIEHLGNEIIKNFSYEEIRMTKYSYPFYPKHKGEHEEFIQVYKNLKERYAKDSSTTSVINTANTSLINWLLSHINTSDKALAKFLRTR